MTTYPIPPIEERWKHRVNAAGLVTRRGRVNITGATDRATDGTAVPEAIATEVDAWLSEARVMIDGTADPAGLSDLASMLFDIPAVIGSEAISFHAIAYGTDERDDAGHHVMSDIGATALIWHNYSGPHAAAVARGEIDADEFPDVRDASAMDLGTRRRVARFPMRTRLPRVWVRDSERGADHEIPAAHSDPARIFIGHRAIMRGETVKQTAARLGARSVVVARSRSDLRDAVALSIGELSARVDALAIGDVIVAVVNGARVRVSRLASERYTATITRDGKRAQYGTNTRHPISSAAAMNTRLARIL